MIYFKFRDKWNEETQNRKPQKEGWFLKLIDSILPKANPDFDGKFSLVSTWYIECDEEDNYPNREIGLDENGKIIMWSPYKKIWDFG